MLLQVKYALIAAALVLLAGLVYTDLPGFPASESSTTASSTVQIHGNMVRVSVADTPETRGSGLSGWKGLGQDEGMLFVFEGNGKPAFWMKDMQFSIDIVWISSAGIVVDIHEAVSPDTYPTVFAPKEDAKYVLELPAGYAQENTVNIGDTVGFNLR